MDSLNTHSNKLEASRSDSKHQGRIGLKRVTDDDLYRISTQYRIWSFKIEQLTKVREDLNANAAKEIQQQIQKFTLSHPQLLEDELLEIQTQAVPLSVDEELKLVNFYAKKVQKFSSSLNLPTEVTATAISFFRKFFLSNSTMEVHPKSILLTAIFLACKSENYFIGIDSFSQKTKSNKESILAYEFKLLESLKFTLLNHHPYKTLHGFFLDIQATLNGKVDLDYLGQIYTNCKKRISDAILTDVVYHYTPPQITLAILLVEDEALMERYLELKFHDPTLDIKSEDKDLIKPGEDKKPPQKFVKNSISLSKLKTILTECKEIIFKKDSTSKDEVTKIDAKLHYCQNPMLLVRRLKRQKESFVGLGSPDNKRQCL